MGLGPHKRGSREIPSPFHHGRHSKRAPAMKQEDSPHLKATMLPHWRHPASRAVSCTFLFARSYAVCDILLWKPEQTKAVINSKYAKPPKDVGVVILFCR